MEDRKQQEQFNSCLPLTHLLQHTLRTLCLNENPQWVYAVYWRILPRNFPPPKWDDQAGGVHDRSRGNRRNWILVWEDGFCNFAEANTGSTSSSAYTNNSEFQHQYQGLQPELFFKMSHDIYNYGEGLIGKVAADQGHKWIFYNEHNDDHHQDINFVSAWHHNSVDTHPRTWEAQFRSGIKTIALVALREGVLQLGAIHKVNEDLSYVVMLRKKFGYIESMPGVLLPHPGSGTCPLRVDSHTATPHDAWNFNRELPLNDQIAPCTAMRIAPSMSSLEALLSKLPSVVLVPDFEPADQIFSSSTMPIGEDAMLAVGKEEERGGDGSVPPPTSFAHRNLQRFG